MNSSVIQTPMLCYGINHNVMNRIWPVSVTLTLGIKKRSALNLYNQSSRKWKRSDSMSSPFARKTKQNMLTENQWHRINWSGNDPHPLIPLQLCRSVQPSLCLSCSQTCPWHTAQRLLPDFPPRSEFCWNETCAQIKKKRDKAREKITKSNKAVLTVHLLCDPNL